MLLALKASATLQPEVTSPSPVAENISPTATISGLKRISRVGPCEEKDESMSGD